MLLTLTSTVPDAAPAETRATDLGYLLHKHPGRAQTFDESVGRVHVCYPEATDDRCTVAVLLEVDPVGLVRRGRSGGDAFALGQYVNDRPYAASSMLAVAVRRVFGTAMAGRCEQRPDLVDRRWPLRVELPAVPCRGGPDLAERLFAPLGWRVDATPLPLDPEVPEWGDSHHVDLRLTGEQRLADALRHLYVLLPVLDDAKHYWVGADEVDKLLRTAGTWLPDHPERDLITRRYLVNQRGLVNDAVARLAELEGLDGGTPTDEEAGADAPHRESLARQRRQAVFAELREARASRVVDLGCGEGALLRELLADPSFTEVVGVDVADRALRAAERRLGLDRLPDRQRERLRLWQSSLTYRDRRLAGFDAAVLMEVIEHVDPDRLPALEHNVLHLARPATVLVTTPNAEHNVRFRWLPPGAPRHPDHRFEWCRAEFRAWAERVAAHAGYRVRFRPVGEDDPEVGPPTQMAVFRRADTEVSP
ncbi:3' terminal RNA ribose 2'-O-methyltransferase Hen1 [Gandjariella thermophila]|uniref:Small RNA 2'-O-methyltransferase n=1 Tax=Gandjariella thermophila TaxID=1931992 RepID=A0A4D4J809_9PSEU|nr:3' terminal RNA ribose 2'-O-methyltransferase Hen1 [Gandjariella thermophila]GDY31654.1 3' terminal RNA ribose 2'-O-methyltransferase Hen1 [Gandjariella thermophila]